MNDQPTHFLYSPYFYNCRDCERELWTEQERKMGLCLHCVEQRVHLTVRKLPTLILNPPTSSARWN